jgi:hypothetical protein
MRAALTDPRAKVGLLVSLYTYTSQKINANFPGSPQVLLEDHSNGDEVDDAIVPVPLNMGLEASQVFLVHVCVPAATRVSTGSAPKHISQAHQPSVSAKTTPAAGIPSMALQAVACSKGTIKQ